MRIEKVNNKLILCGGIIHPSFIQPNQEWMSSSGHSVFVDSVTSDEHEVRVLYSWSERGELKSHEKDHFSFQCRYCLVLESEDELEKYLN